MVKATRKNRTRARGDTGVAAIEFVIVFPMLLLIFVCAITLTQYTSVNRKIQMAAKLAADLITRHDETIQTTSIDDYFTAVELLLRPMNINNVRIDVYDYYRDTRTNNVALRWNRSSPNGGSCNQPSSTNTSAIGTVVLNQPNDVVVAVACVRFSMTGGNLLGLGRLFNNRLIRYEMIMVARESKTLTCQPNNCL